MRAAPSFVEPARPEPIIDLPREVTMHGEYKTPGGKLVAVDLEISDGHLTNVVVSGDFFLYPEEVLTDITAALDGLPSDLTVSEYAEKIMMAMPRTAELLGSSPEAIATAVRRALTDGVEKERS